MNNQQPIIIGLILGVLIAVGLASMGAAQPAEKATVAKAAAPTKVTSVRPWQEAPADLHQRRRFPNGNGSCVHASVCSALENADMHQEAVWWWANHRGGSGIGEVMSICNAHGIKYAATYGENDYAFLQRCSDSRRMAAIHYGSHHYIDFCGFKDGKAWLLDNNRKEHYYSLPKSEFMRQWSGYGSEAWTPLKSPGPPMPYVKKEPKS